MATAVATSVQNPAGDVGNYHQEQLKKIEDEYTELKKQLISAKLEQIQKSLAELAEGTYSKLTEGLLEIENEAEKQYKKAARERDQRLETAKFWLECEEMAAENHRKHLKHLKESKLLAMGCRIFHLKQQKKAMDADPPPYEARPFKVKTRTPIWNNQLHEKTAPDQAVVEREAERYVSKLQQESAAPSRTSRRNSSQHEGKRSRRAKTYDGPCIIYHLTSVEIEDDLLRMTAKRSKHI